MSADAVWWGELMLYNSFNEDPISRVFDAGHLIPNGRYNKISLTTRFFQPSKRFSWSEIIFRSHTPSFFRPSWTLYLLNSSVKTTWMTWTTNLNQSPNPTNPKVLCLLSKTSPMAGWGHGVQYLAGELSVFRARVHDIDWSGNKQKSWLALFATFGYASSFGVFQDFYVLHGTSTSSNVSWIGSTSLFFFIAMGLPAGKLVDSGYFKHVLFAGSLLYIFS